jgi:hypothetical protein
MVTLPFTLAGKWKLVSDDVVSLFGGLWTEINGKLGTEHFAPRANIANSQKAQPYGLAAVQARIPATLSGGTLICRAPPRSGSNIWQMQGFSLAVTGNEAAINPGYGISGRLDFPLLDPSVLNPQSGAGAHSITLTNPLNSGAPFNWDGDRGVPGSGDVVMSAGFGNILPVNQPLIDLVLTVWYKTRHQR